MLPITIILGKIIRFGLKAIGRRGSALPGYVIEKIDRRFLQKTLGGLPDGVIIVTGTNGKTTTTKALTQLLESEGLRVLTNETGSNFVRGIIATVAEKIRINGKLDYDIAVFEQDEAYAVHFVRHVAPRGLVALNVMRDQMDRFGEIDKTAQLILKTAAGVSEWLVLNANDTRIARVASDKTELKVKWFGHDEELLPSFIGDDQHHGESLTFYQADEPEVCLTRLAGDSITIRRGKDDLSFKPLLEGTHNALNLAAAIAAADIILPDIPPSKLIPALESIRPAFGRGEVIQLKNNGTLHMQLVKNPAGFTHGLRLLDNKNFTQIAIAINDNYPDGRDVSWLWDVDFSRLEGQNNVICGGIRAYDMAVRLKHDGCNAKQINTEFKEFVGEIVNSPQENTDTVVFCTYTAMLQTRQLLKKYASSMNKEGL